MILDSTITFPGLSFAELQTSWHKQPVARLEYIGDRSFHLAFMRHTEKWWNLPYALSLETCLKKIEEGGFFEVYF